MGWWPWSESSDPIKDLDPDLRDFLNKQEASQKPTSNTSRPTPAEDTSSYRSRLGFTSPDDSSTPHKPHPSDPPPLPAESLYPDGRYAHLWRSYRPQSEVEQAGRSDQEKLADIAYAFRARRQETKDAALENCAETNLALHECFVAGGVHSRLTMCRQETRALEKCLVTQSRILRALGYMNMWERSEDEAERIQMHADRLYGRMQAQERALEEARAKGLPPPELEPLIRERRPPAERRYRFGAEEGGKEEEEEEETEEPLRDEYEIRPETDIFTFDSMSPEEQERMMREKWKDLSPPALEVAKSEWNQQVRMVRTLTGRLTDRRYEDRRDRIERLEQGKEKWSDMVKRWFDMRSYPELERDEMGNPRAKRGGEGTRGEKQ